MLNHGTTNLLCNSSDSVLIIIDIQERLSTAMPDKVLTNIIDKTIVLSRAAGLLDIPVITSEQYPKGLGSTVDKILPSLPASSMRLEKTCFSCAKDTNILAQLKTLNKKQVILCGMETHICVTQTAIELQEMGYQVFIASDAVCSRTESNYKNALQRMQQAQCVITNTESICFEWLADATHSHFKAISNLIK